MQSLGVSIESDDPQVERTLERVVQQTRAVGAWIDPAVTIHAEEGSLSIRTSLPAGTPACIIAVPEAGLLPVSKVELGVSGDDLFIRSFADDLSPERRQLFETLVELYNLTGKMAWQRKVSPWLACADDRELLERVVAGRAAAPAVANFNAQFLAGSAERLAVDTFVKTRTLNFRPVPAGEGEPVLMPVLDFLNHHPNGAPFENRSDRIAGPQMAVVNCKPVRKSGETFVSYGMPDAYDTFLIYNYVDGGAPFVRSIPLLLEHPSVGRIVVRSVIGLQQRTQLPPELADLGPYLPRIDVPRPGEVEVSTLMIPPPSASPVLLRVLEQIVRAARPGIDAQALGGHVQGLAGAVVARNIAFYEELQAYLQSKPATDRTRTLLEQARLMAATQLRKLRAWPRVA